MVSLGQANHWMNSKIWLYVVLILLPHILHRISCLNVMQSGLGPQRKSGPIQATFPYKVGPKHQDNLLKYTLNHY